METIKENIWSGLVKLSVISQCMIGKMGEVRVGEVHKLPSFFVDVNAGTKLE